jgi:hypothetical protein
VPALAQALEQGEVAEGVAAAYGRPQLLARLLLVRSPQCWSPQCRSISPLVKQLLSAPVRKLARMRDVRFAKPTARTAVSKFRRQ